MVAKIGQLEAVLDAAGESDNEIGGLNQTRLTSVADAIVQAPDTFDWIGGSYVFSYPREPTELSVGDWIRLDEEGVAYEILSIAWDPVKSRWNVEIDAPNGSGITNENSVTGNVTWNGTTSITLVDWEEVSAGMWIRADSDYQWFQVVSSGPTGTVIANPWGFTIPSGSLASSMSTNPVTSIVETSLAVETTLGWPDSGKLVVEGVVYEYASRTDYPPSFDELTHTQGNGSVIGLKKDHTEQATVTDLSSSRSAIELVKRALLVEYAEGEDLNAIGRNMGVLRYPFLESDDVFRAIVKALAYNPKGTMFGLELALTAMVGEGNFVITEDLINYPNTVFITLLGGPFTSDSFEGKAYLAESEYQLPGSSTSVSIEESVADRGHIHSVTYRDEDHLSDFRTALPSADSIVEYEGSVGVPVWAYSGSNEGTDVTLISGEGIEITHVAGFNGSYGHEFRVLPESYASVNCTMFLDSTGVLNASSSWYNQWTLRMEDSDYRIGWGVYDQDASTFNIGLVSAGFVTGAVITQLAKDAYHDIEIRKYGTDRVELYINGSLVDSKPYALFTSSTTGNKIWFGIIATGAPAVKGRFRQVGYYAHTATDFWNARGAAGSVATASPTEFDTNDGALALTSADVGKRFQITGSTTANPQGGNNDGIYDVTSIVSGDTVDLQGRAQENGTVQSAQPLRFVADEDGQQFQFPDDLGKTLVISGSSQGNDGSYTIDKLLDDVTLVDLESFATPIRQKTTICEVTAATFVSEGGLDWRLDPAFVTETPLDWELSDAGSFSGTTLTLRQALPSTEVVAVIYSQVLSAQILLDIAIHNELTQLLPTLLFSYYPFYLSDPLGFIRIFLDDVTAAGVIPEFLEDL